MKGFNFHSVKNVKEAKKLSSGKSAFLAGGMTTIPAMKLRLASYSDIIDIKNIKDLSGIKVSSKSLRIGATTKHAEVAASKEVKKAISSLAHLADGIGDPQVRNRGTIGGSIANNDPAADYPAACLALNAIIHTSDRKIDADKFFKGTFETATSACLVVAPILRLLLDTLIPDKSLIFFISIISEYEANLSFIAGIVVIPPAKKADLPEANFFASFTFFTE